MHARFSHDRVLALCAIAGLLLACGAGPGLAPPHLVALQQGETALALGEATEALRHYQHARRLEPGSPRALRGLALAHLALGELDAALPVFDALARSHPDRFDRELREAHCRALEDAVALDLARGLASPAALRAVGRASNSCPEARRHRLAGRAMRAAAEQARREGRSREALAAYRALLEHDPADAEAALHAAGFLLEAGREDEAIELLSGALFHHPEDRGLVEKMVEVLGDVD